ncbi:MAG: hypothetical protein RMK18_08335 [Armatimonadota bacterium]|nr:hypothetical protein [Armatimonadota bacterium]MCX7777857.1 hypothetical protein [Armatimonadota bacterium]MDW8025849.1 hypothetical protein [Armatimonadota bacterium]
MVREDEFESAEAAGKGAVELTAQERYENEIGKRPCGRLRRDGYVPAVVYGASVKSVPIKLKIIDVKRAFGGLPKIGSEVTLKVQTQGGDMTLKCIVKEFQVDPLSLQLLSIDFHAIE